MGFSLFLMTGVEISGTVNSSSPVKVSSMAGLPQVPIWALKILPCNAEKPG